MATLAGPSSAARAPRPAWQPISRLRVDQLARRAFLATVDWDAVRREYEAETDTVEAIAERLGLRIHEIRNARLRYGWQARSPAAAAGLRVGAAARRPIDPERALRVLIAEQIAVLRRRIAAEGLDREAAALLNQLCRAGRTMGMTNGSIATESTKAGGDNGGERADGGRTGAAGGPRRAPRPDPAALRAELKAKIDRIRSLRATYREPGLPERD